MNKDLLSSSFASVLRNSLHRSETESAHLGTLLVPGWDPVELEGPEWLDGEKAREDPEAA